MKKLILGTLIAASQSIQHRQHRRATLEEPVTACKANQYTTTLNELASTQTPNYGKNLYTLSESISSELGKYEQLGRQQSHRYALAMGSINGKLAVLDDPKRAES